MEQLNSAIEKIPADNPLSEAGFSMVEVLVSLGLLSIVALCLTYSTLMSFNALDRSKRQATASQLANERMEILAAVNPVNLGDTYDLTESSLTSRGISFRRITDVTVNADNSRSVTVTVTSNGSSRVVSAAMNNTFALWGSN